jgi:hypothetical protein
MINMVTRRSIMTIVILIVTATIIAVTTAIIKGQLLCGVTNFRTSYIFHTVIPTTSRESCEERVSKIFALVWTVPSCPY